MGIHYTQVQSRMLQFEKRCRTLMRNHDEWLEGRGKSQPPEIALLKFVTVLAEVLQLFLTIHPYADGNGHTGRLLTFTMMVRAGYSPRNWDIDAKHAYGVALFDHRRGKTLELQRYMLAAI